MLSRLLLPPYPHSENACLKTALGLCSSMGKDTRHQSKSNAHVQPVSENRLSDDEADPLVSDPRFNAASWDPRFSRVPKRAKNAVADDRFTSKLKKDLSFRDKKTPVDRYGRPKKRPKLDYTMQTLAEDDDQNLVDNESSSDEGEQLHGPEADVDQELSQTEDDIDTDELDDLEEFEVHEESLETIPRGEATSRLAVIGLDWSVTRAVDILASLGCFCPTGKNISYVEVHPSKFGLERLEIEAKLGPQVVPEEDLRVVRNAGRLPQMDPDNRDGPVTNPNENEESGDDRGVSTEDADEDADAEASDDDEGGNVPMFEDDGEVAERERKEQAALRKYEEDRLKYYYAVVKCEDVKTADALYEQCDGVEYSQTGQCFDLRFIPNDMEITTMPRDRAECVPDGYTPPVVNVSSVNNSTVKLSWDTDEPDRVILKKKAFGKYEMYEQDLKAYLASSSEDEDKDEGGDEAKGRNKELAEEKRNALLGAVNEDDAEEDEAEMEVTFEPGMLEKGEEFLKRKLKRDGENDETPWEARMRRSRERKQEKRRERRAAIAKATGDAGSDGENSTGSVDNGSEDSPGPDPLFVSNGDQKGPTNVEAKISKSRRTKNRNAPNGESFPDDDEVAKQKQRVELELLTMEDARSIGGTLRDKLADADSDEEELRRQRKKGKRTRGKRRSQKQKEDEQRKESKESLMDTNDDRFQSVFNSHLFAIDPTHPKYRDDDTTRKIMKEKGRRSVGALNANGASGIAKPKDSKGSGSSAQEELRRLAARVKARAENRKKRVKG